MTGRAGLSLFELLIALALLALIAAGLAGALNIAVSVYDRSRPVASAGEDMALRTRLRGWAASALPPSRLAQFPVTFVGAQDQFEFTTIAAKGFAPEAAALRVFVEAEGDALMLRVVEMDDDGAEIRRHEALLARGARPDFAYFDAAADPPLWRPDWAYAARLPGLIRIEVPEGSQPEWPEFTVRPRLR